MNPIPRPPPTNASSGKHPPNTQKAGMVSRKMEIIHESEKFSQLFLSYENLLHLKEKGLVPFTSCQIIDNYLELQRRFVQGKSLNEYLTDKTRLTTAEVHQLAMSIMSIVYRLHSFGVTLRLIKPSNIIILSTGEVKFVDCGYEVIYKDNLIKKVTPLTTLFAGPEQFDDSNPMHSEKHDIWCLGLVIYYMFFGKYPYEISSISLIKSQLSSQNVSFPPDINLAFTDLLGKMLNHSPEQRPCVAFILQTLSGITIPENFFKPPPLRKSSSFSHQSESNPSQNAQAASLLKQQSSKITRATKGKSFRNNSSVDARLSILRVETKTKPKSHSIRRPN